MGARRLSMDPKCCHAATLNVCVSMRALGRTGALPCQYLVMMLTSSYKFWA